MKKSIQPRLGTVVTMIIGILFLFLIFSQAGKYHESGYIMEKAEERLALRKERKKVMLQIGVNDNIAIKTNSVKLSYKIAENKINNNIQNNNKITSNILTNNQVSTKNKTKIIKKTIHSLYTVKQGDTLFGIAQKIYGDGNKWRKILNGNNKLKKPNQLRTGMKLNIPEPTESNTAYIKWQKHNKI